MIVILQAPELLQMSLNMILQLVCGYVCFSNNTSDNCIFTDAGDSESLVVMLPVIQ